MQGMGLGSKIAWQSKAKVKMAREQKAVQLLRLEPIALKRPEGTEQDAWWGRPTSSRDKSIIRGDEQTITVLWDLPQTSSQENNMSR